MYYKTSNISMTRKVAEVYPEKFTDDHIIERSEMIATLLNKLTSVDLGIPVI